MGLLDTMLGHAGEKNVADLQDDLGPLLAEGEAMQRAFGFVRDVMVFTDRRLLLVNKQGITGSKVEYLSIPYRAIVMYSLETAGHFDLDAELKVWVSGQPAPLSYVLGRNSGATDVVSVLARHVR